MSKIDLTTVIIVVVLVIALGFLGYQLYQLYVNKDPAPTEPVEDPALLTDTLPSDDVYDMRDDDDMLSDTTDFFANDPDTRPQTDLYPDEPSGSMEGDFMVLAGTYSIKESAESEAQRIRSMGYPNTTHKPFNQGTYEVVIVDRFDSYGRASSLAKELRNEHNLEAFVLKKRYQPVN